MEIGITCVEIDRQRADVIIDGVKNGGVVRFGLIEVSATGNQAYGGRDRFVLKVLNTRGQVLSSRTVRYVHPMLRKLAQLAEFNVVIPE